MFTEFFLLLEKYGIPISMQYILDFYKGLEKGIVNNLDELFIFSRLIFVKKVEHMEDFHRAFAFYFFGTDIPKVKEGDMELFSTKPFQEWLKNAIKNGDLPSKYWNLSREELMKKFWDTVREQMEAHNGGNKWVGTGGTSPFGHSGFSERGVRVGGTSGNRSAIKIIGERSYIEYSDSNTLKGENIRQALGSLKNLKPDGAHTELNIDETIRKTSRNGGEIELIFEQDKRDKIEVVLLIDNGGTSMLPYVSLTKILFEKMSDRFKNLSVYYFHNTIYSKIYRDYRRHEEFSVSKLLQRKDDVRIIFVGDASMAPEELLYGYGSIYFEDEEAEPSIYWLNKIKEKFKHVVWLNPISNEEWNSAYGSYTIKKIREIFHMEDLTLRGIKNAVEYLNQKN